MPVWDHELSLGEEEDWVRRATQITLDRYNACLPLFKAVEEYITSKRTQDRDLVSHPLKLVQHLTPEEKLYLLTMEVGRPMRPFITSSGYIGLGPMTLQPDDVVSIFFGARVPHILRRREHGEGGYSFVGEAFVYGLMDGEALDLGRKPTTFEVF